MLYNAGCFVKDGASRSYFGNFVNGKKSGRGVQMHLTKGAAGIEVLDANSRQLLRPSQLLSSIE